MRASDRRRWRPTMRHEAERRNALVTRGEMEDALAALAEDLLRRIQDPRR